VNPEAIDAILDQMEASLRELAGIMLQLKEAATGELTVQQNVRLAMAMVRFQAQLEAPDKMDKFNTFLGAFQKALETMEDADED
jgi:hypothetical protein